MSEPIKKTYKVFRGDKGEVYLIQLELQHLHPDDVIHANHEALLSAQNRLLAEVSNALWALNETLRRKS